MTSCSSEASDKLGGNLIPASQHSFKEDMRMLNEWFQRELKEKGVVSGSILLQAWYE